MTVWNSLWGAYAVDFVLLVVVVEIAYFGWRARARPGVLVSLALAFMPGVCLLLALHAALVGAGLPWILAFLSASLPFHLADLAQRRF